MILVRHGQSHFNLHYGRTRQDPGIVDPRLTDEGRRQARALASALAAEGVARLIASPYWRTLETAEIIADLLGLPVTVDPLVRERACFACDIGTPRAGLQARWPTLELDMLAERWWPEAEEPEDELLRRCAGFRRQAAAMADRQRVGVITHWGFIRGLTGQAVGNCETVVFDPLAHDARRVG